MSSDSEDEQQLAGYRPVLAERILASPSVAAPSSVNWPRDGVSTYENTLFTNPGGRDAAATMQSQKSSQASRRAERIQGDFYRGNDATINHNPLSFPPSRANREDPAYDADGADSDPGSPANGSRNVYGLKASFDPADEDQQDALDVESVNRSLPDHDVRAPKPLMDILTDLRDFVTRPGPRGKHVLCAIRRDKGSAKMYPKYTLVLEDGARFMLAARKRKKQTSSNYIVTLDSNDLARESHKVVGKLRSNFVGTDFTIYGEGQRQGGERRVTSLPSFKRLSDVDDDEADLRRPEYGCVAYQYNVLGTRGPRKMTCAIPLVDADGFMEQPPSGDSTPMVERMKNNCRTEDLLLMQNRPPRWNEELNAYCLNFHGRVTEASVKNFQLVTPDEPSNIILQFGKTGKDTFSMDFQYPISAFQAFCICLSSFDNKLACE